MKYSISILFSLLFFLQSCGQNNKALDKEVNEILGNLYKDVKNYDQRINYHAMIFIGGCNYEVLINDFPVDRYFGEGNGAASGSAPINRAILKSGLQTWKIRIYPIHDIKEINGKVTMLPRNTIQEGARVEIAIEGIQFKENGDIEKRFGKVVDFKAPLKKDDKTGKNIFAEAGKPYIEYSGTFQADVPYQLAGWEEGEDLYKLDKSTLEKQLLNKYKEYSNWIQNRNLEKIAKSNLNSEKEESQALFYDKQTNQSIINNNYINGWGAEGLKVYPLENYKIKFFGNGKLATLERSDYVGDPILAGEYVNKNNKNEEMKVFYLYFYIPKGKTELEVIR
ncbi:hypothetical protein [Chryseobacterium oryctis]|uniref:Uncharacterized protein n=1 Tax=Chryseobacterium oryctis TaxID=2952618 RepID=A0ABT3HMV0_9FLAO|nr:hypothetical protein [Chryseobacterium oryctis]MCW3161097.1 hypothetical protein [Chryseobacterium oryctis]